LIAYNDTPFSFSTAHTFSGVIGMSMLVTPRCASASTTAFAIAGGVPDVGLAFFPHQVFFARFDHVRGKLFRLLANLAARHHRQVEHLDAEDVERMRRSRSNDFKGGSLGFDEQHANKPAF
jgi:hypothetical protein